MLTLKTSLVFLIITKKQKQSMKSLNPNPIVLEEHIRLHFYFLNVMWLKQVKAYLIGICVRFNSEKSMIFSDKTIQAERLSYFFEDKGKVSDNDFEKMALTVMKNPGGQ